MSKIPYQMGEDIYEVVETVGGDKIIRPLFYLYVLDDYYVLDECEENADKYPGRLASFDIEFPLSVFVARWAYDNDAIKAEIDESVYLEDLTIDEYDLEAAKATSDVIAQLSYDDVTVDTPCGVYMT